VADLSTDPASSAAEHRDMRTDTPTGTGPESRESPKSPGSSLWSIVKRMWQELQDDGLFDAAAGVAFWLILSLPAALLAVLSAVALLGEDLTADLQISINEFVERTFTTESETIRSAVDGLF
jgi:uncharacterized BrkB/YihY/UPF0761 family membrane protein